MDGVDTGCADTDGNHGFDGRSLLPVLTGQATTFRDYVFSQHTTVGINGYLEPYPMRAVRDICEARALPHTCDDSWGGDIIAAECVHVGATVQQVAALAQAGSELVRITVDRDEAAKAVPRIREQLAKLSRHEQIRSFKLLDRRFTVEAGHLTPKTSLRRDIIQRDFAREIEQMD